MLYISWLPLSGLSLKTVLFKETKLDEKPKQTFTGHASQRKFNL